MIEKKRRCAAFAVCGSFCTLEAALDAYDQALERQPDLRPALTNKALVENLLKQKQTPPAAELLKKAAGVAKGSGTPHTDKVGHVTADQLREIAKVKEPDLNANDLDMAARIIAGTARSMGITSDAI